MYAHTENFSLFFFLSAQIFLKTYTARRAHLYKPLLHARYHDTILKARLASHTKNGSAFQEQGKGNKSQAGRKEERQQEKNTDKERKFCSDWTKPLKPPPVAPGGGHQSTST